ncbi:unnamed protein product [Tilletia controversa]|nr:unnamed protein product [Tilletia controversa]CAD6936084.1 unnamed protein product [Tilletia controversa]
MNALAHIVNKVADIKKAQAHLRDADPGVVAAFKDRLAAIRQYKAWLFEHTGNSAPPDLTDAAIARLHGKILPVLERLPRSNRRRLDRDVQRNPLRYLRYFFLPSDSLLRIKPSLQPVLRSAFQYVGSQNPPNALALYDKSQEQLKTEAWEFVFDLTKSPFGSTTQWILDASVRTDGVAILVHKRQAAKQQETLKVGSKGEKIQELSRICCTGLRKRQSASSPRRLPRARDPHQ